jgi:hypothetical protein
MRLPGFTANASLYASSVEYKSSAIGEVRTGGVSIVPQRAAVWRYMWVCDVGGDCYWAWVSV